MTPAFRLILRSGPHAGQVYNLDKNEYYIGRDPANDIVVDDPEVSRRHARIYLQGQYFVVEDMGSRNGVIVNGEKINSPCMLRAGEVFSLGETTSFQMESPRVDSVDTVAAPGRQAYAPAQHIPPPQYQQQGYAQQMPPPQMRTPPPPQYYPPPYNQSRPKKKGSGGLVLVLLILIVLCVCLVVGGLIAVDTYYPEFYCKYASFLFNLINPGACP